MKKIMYLILIILSIFVLSSILSAQEKGEVKEKQIYYKISGKYEMDVGNRLIPFCVVYRPKENKVYMEVTDNRQEVMIPDESDELKFTSVDPRGQELEMVFGGEEKGKITKCEITMISNGMVYQAFKILKYDKTAEQEDNAEKIHGKADDKIFEKLGIEFVHISGGTFEMGDTFGEGSKRELPVHTVNLDDFSLSKTEVTFAQYDKFCEETGIDKPNDEGWGRGSRPVINVSWDDASAFCRWLSQKSGKEVRLPTGAEWEYAAREGGKKVRFGNGKNTADPAEINFDGTAEKKKDYSQTGEFRQKTLPAAGFSPNKLGLYDMSGNVWEWCEDWFERDYKYSISKNPKGPSFVRWYKVMRGGTWKSGPAGVRNTIRGAFTPEDSANTIGFRIAMSK